MSRKAYGLSDETIEVVKNRKGIAFEFGCNVSYINGVMQGNDPDPFAYFKPWYAALVRSGEDVTPYKASLSSIDAAYNKSTPLTATECLSRKIERDADATLAIMKALENGEIDENEWRLIDKALERQEQAIGLIRGVTSGHECSGNRATDGRQAEGKVTDTKTRKAIGELLQKAYRQFGGKGGCMPVILRSKK